MRQPGVRGCLGDEAEPWAALSAGDGGCAASSLFGRRACSSVVVAGSCMLLPGCLTIRLWCHNVDLSRYEHLVVRNERS